MRAWLLCLCMVGWYVSGYAQELTLGDYRYVKKGSSWYVSQNGGSAADQIIEHRIMVRHRAGYRMTENELNGYGLGRGTDLLLGYVVAEVKQG